MIFNYLVSFIIYTISSITLIMSIISKHIGAIIRIEDCKDIYPQSIINLLNKYSENDGLTIKINYGSEIKINEKNDLTINGITIFKNNEVCVCPNNIDFLLENNILCDNINVKIDCIGDIWDKVRHFHFNCIDVRITHLNAHHDNLKKKYYGSMICNYFFASYVSGRCYLDRKQFYPLIVRYVYEEYDLRPNYSKTFVFIDKPNYPIKNSFRLRNIEILKNLLVYYTTNELTNENIKDIFDCGVMIIIKEKGGLKDIIKNEDHCLLSNFLGIEALDKKGNISQEFLNKCLSIV